MMRTKWFVRFSVLVSLAFLGAVSYVLIRGNRDLSLHSHQAADSTAPSSTPSIMSEPSKESPSERAGGSVSRQAYESAERAESSRDFSGITTIDPALATPAPTATPGPKQKSTVPLPLVFQPIDPAFLKITSEQQQIIDELQQGFLDEVGGADQDPNDPQYRQRWEQARPLFDQRLKAQLGQRFFLNYEIAAGQEAEKNK